MTQRWLAMVLLGLVAWHGAAQGEETGNKEEARAGEGEAQSPPDWDAWRQEMKRAKGRLNTLSLFSQLTHLQKVKLPIPAGVQRVKLEEDEATRDLAKHVRIFLRDVEFRGLSINQDVEPIWRKKRPVYPTTLTFEHIRLFADAKTKLGTIPLEGTFTNGTLPVNLAVLRNHDEINVTPAYRRDEGKIGGIKVTSSVPFSGGILTKLLADDLAEVLLDATLDQTLRLEQGQLLGGGGGVDLGIIAPFIGDEETREVLEDDRVRNLVDQLLGGE